MGWIKNSIKSKEKRRFNRKKLILNEKNANKRNGFKNEF